MVAEICKCLVNVGFEQGEVNLCLIFWKNEYSILILILYVDNCLLTGDVLAIESGVNNIKKMFNVTVTKMLKSTWDVELIQAGRGK